LDFAEYHQEKRLCKETNVYIYKNQN